MLDMGFIPDIEEICTKLPKTRQTLLFSATMPPPIKKLADKFLSNPKTIEVARPATTNTNITQKLVQTTTMKKRDTLRALIDRDNVSTAIVFCNRKTTVRELNKSLKRHGYRSGEIHGDMEQPQRLAELELFKRGEINILVASDVAARGLDIKGVSHVFNFDAPWHPDDYVHRIGRTGRAGATGTAYTLVTSEDAENIENIEKLTGQTIPRETIEVEDRERPKRARRGEKAADEAETPRERKPRREAEPAAPPPTPAREAKRPRRDDRRRDRDDGPDEGWNGPVPAFLEVKLGV
jgi:superfamily II DNA/RNA helicase